MNEINPNSDNPIKKYKKIFKDQSLPPSSKSRPKEDPEANPEENTESSTKDKVKKIFRDIAKLTHPDKVDDENLTSLYIEAKIAYDNYDLFELYFISNKLNIILDLAEDDINVLTILIDHKKNSLKGIETSFIWKWVHTNDEEQKEKIINDFVDINYKQYKK